MYHSLAKYVKEVREQKGWKRSRLATELGYKNLNKGCRLIHRFETEGVIRRDLFRKMVKVLDLDREKAKRLHAEDERIAHEAWEKWVNEPVPMKLVARLMAAVYANLPIDQNLSEEEAIDYAKKMAAKRHQQLCLVLSRKVSIYISEDGEKTDRSEAKFCGPPNQPVMYVKGRPFQLTFSK